MRGVTFKILDVVFPKPIGMPDTN